MKNRLLTVSLVLSSMMLLSSCGKKDWICECSYEVDAFFFVVTESESETYEKLTEEDAQADCDAFGNTVKSVQPTAACTLTEQE
jgi:hypothetical protein